MEFSDIVTTRRSIRAFDHRPVEDEKLNSILRAACHAPSAGNLQAYEICVIRNKQVLRALAAAALGQVFIAGAPLALVFSTHPERSALRYGERGRQLYAVQDATIACTFAMLAAHDQGLATVWIGAFDERGVRRAIGGPEDWIPVAILPIGYGAETPSATSRRSLGSLIHRIE